MTRTLLDRRPDDLTPPSGWHQLVDRALGERIVDPEQARRLHALVEGRSEGTSPSSDAPEEQTGRWAPLAEALGYVGAALVVVAGFLVAQEFWSELTWSVRGGVLGVLAVALLAAGAALQDEASSAAGRLGSVVWLGATAALAGSLAVVSREGLPVDRDVATLAAAAGTTGAAAMLWALRPMMLQQLALLAGGLVAGGSLLMVADVDEAAMAVLATGGGALWMIGAARGAIEPVRTAWLAGAATALIGPMFALDAVEGWAALAGLAVVGAVVAAAVRLRDPALLAESIAGLLVFVPILVTAWFEGQLAVPIALLATGSALLAVGLTYTRVDPR